MWGAEIPPAVGSADCSEVTRQMAVSSVSPGRGQGNLGAWCELLGRRGTVQPQQHTWSQEIPGSPGSRSPSEFKDKKWSVQRASLEDGDLLC